MVLNWLSVFSINWDGSDGDEPYPGFREEGFLPDALLNFLAFLGWNPGNDEEISPPNQLINLFSLDRIVKSGADLITTKPNGTTNNT